MVTQDITVAAGASAFGDGRHPSTAGALEALEAIDPQHFTPGRACDVGCGSGILSLAIARLFGCTVMATDTSRQAIETTLENAASNGLSSLVTPIHASGFDDTRIGYKAPFDLIVMNILAEPLIALARPAEQHLAAGGVLILSGLLRWQEETLRQAYGGLGLELAHRLSLGDWVTLVWQKP